MSIRSPNKEGFLTPYSCFLAGFNLILLEILDKYVQKCEEFFKQDPISFVLLSVVTDCQQEG